MKAIWTGQDSDGRELRAYLVTDDKARDYTGKTLAGPNRVALDTELPALEFRSPKKWTADPEDLEFRREMLNVMARRAERTGHFPKRIPPEPRETGTTWVRVATVSMREVLGCRRLGMSMGVANGKRRPGLLSLQTLGVLLVACDRQQEAR